MSLISFKGFESKDATLTRADSHLKHFEAPPTQRGNNSIQMDSDA